MYSDLSITTELLAELPAVGLTCSWSHVLWPVHHDKDADVFGAERQSGLVVEDRVEEFS